jgi:outer membrane biogenesis lipoprotein LolB
LTRRLTLVVLALAALLLAACGERKEPTAAPAQQRLRLMLE